MSDVNFGPSLLEKRPVKVAYIKININIMLLLFLFMQSMHSSMAYGKNPTLTFSQTPLGERFFCAHKALKKAYAQLNYDVGFITYPSKRALREANVGRVDGEMLRATGAELDYPNLIRIPVPICAIESVLIANKAIEISSLADLKKYRIGITTGYVDQEKIVKEHQLNVTRGSRDDILESLLVLDRVEIIFSTREKAQKLIPKYLNQENINLSVVKAPKRYVYLYHYVHKKHQPLVMKLTDVLKELVAKGELDIEDIEPL